MFLVSLLYERKCFRTDVLKDKLLPECSVYYLVSLCVEIDNVCFAKHPRNDWEGICLFADKQLKFMP